MLGIKSAKNVKDAKATANACLNAMANFKYNSRRESYLSRRRESDCCRRRESDCNCPNKCCNRYWSLMSCHQILQVSTFFKVFLILYICSFLIFLAFYRLLTMSYDCTFPGFNQTHFYFPKTKLINPVPIGIKNYSKRRLTQQLLNLFKLDRYCLITTILSTSIP